MKKLIVVGILLVAMPILGQNQQKLTLDGAIKQALKNNLDIQISKVSYEQSKTDIFGAKGIYDLNFRMNAEHSDTSRAPRNELQAPSEKQDLFTFSAQQLISTGAQLSLNFTNYKYETTTDYQFSTLNPVYGANTQFRIEQPIFNGFGKKNVEYQINLNKQYSERSLEQLKDTVTGLLTDTESGYLDLLYSVQNLKVAQESLELAKEQSEITKKKVEVGTLAPVDQLQSDANLADAEQKLVSAENLLLAAQDQMKKILNLKQEEWDVTFVPEEDPAFHIQTFDRKKCVDTALKNNPQIKIAQLDMKVSQLGMDYQKDKMKPTVSVYGTLSYDGNNKLPLIDPITGQPVLNPETGIPRIYPGSYHDAFSDMKSLDHQSWSVGINVSFPLQNRAAKASYMRAKLDKTGKDFQLQNAIIQVTNSVRDALRNLNASLRSIDAAKKTRELREKNLEIEKKKFINGMSTNFLVSQREDELSQARISELNAKVSYQKSVVLLKKSMGTLLDERNIKFEEPAVN
jgi:outer membrane protein